MNSHISECLGSDRHTSKQATRTLISATEQNTRYTISTTHNGGTHMLIKLTEISFTTTGIQGRVDRVIQAPIWINTNKIISIDLKAGPEQCPDITRIYLSHNHQYTVLETPEQIISLIKEAQS